VTAGSCEGTTFILLNGFAGSCCPVRGQRQLIRKTIDADPLNLPHESLEWWG
jgi:hypothetical protein